MRDTDQQLVTLAIQPLPTKQIASLLIEEVRSKASQVRKDFAEIEALAHSILQEGQIQPIVVSPKNSEGYYIIQQGERRWRACQQAGLATIEAIIGHSKASELDEIAGELIENIQREALSPLEIANALHCFVQQGWQQKAIAQRLGKTSSFVSTHLSLLKMADCILALYQANRVRDTETLNNLRQLYDLDQHIGQQVCQEALEGGISRQYSRALLNKLKKGLGTTQPVVERPTFPEEVVVDQPLKSPSTPMDSVIKAKAVQVVGAAEVEQALTAPPRPADQAFIEAADTLQPSVVAPTSAEASAKETCSSDRRWHPVQADALRIIVNILNDADFQPGVLMTDRIDYQTDHSWVKIGQGEQAHVVRVPIADIELVRLEALTGE